MPKRIVLQTVVLWREGAQVVPPINRAFDFTAEELKTVESLNPAAIGKIVNGDVTGELVTKTQAEIDADQQAAIDKAIAAFKKEQGITDAPKTDGTGAAGANDVKDPAGANKSDKNAKNTGAKSDKNANSDDSDI